MVVMMDDDVDDKRLVYNPHLNLQTASFHVELSIIILKV